MGTVANSCSTMHKIHDKEFTLEDFSCEHMSQKCILEDIINELNKAREYYNKYDQLDERFKSDYSKKDLWWQMIQLLPSSYNQTRNVMMNYEVLANIYKSRRNHKLNEWVELCKWIETLPYSELICGDEVIDKVADKFCEIGNINPLSKEEIEQAVNLSRIKEE